MPRGREELRPIPRVSAPAGLALPLPFLSYLFWDCTEGHCVPREALRAGPQDGGKERRMALEGAVTKPGAMISDWWAPQDGRR